MDTSSLVTIGLSPIQADAYVYLLEHGEIKPTELATHLKTTRTNTYKLLDKLVELKLASKKESNKKFVYQIANPLALTELTAKHREEAVKREQAASHIMQDLLTKYHSYSDKPGVFAFTGQRRVAEAYNRQLGLREDIYFLHTSADIPLMGFDTMHTIRTAPARHGLKRNAIMKAPDNPKQVNQESHVRSNLQITWHHPNDYDAPVEWSVTKSSLLIVLYATGPHAVLIQDPVVAGAFMQIWQLLHRLLSEQQSHSTIKQHAPVVSA